MNKKVVFGKWISVIFVILFSEWLLIDYHFLKHIITFFLAMTWGFFLFVKKKEYWFMMYLLLVAFILFFREKTTIVISSGDYIKKWLPMLFTNKIVFINIFGNLFLLVPMGFYLALKYSRLTSIIVIVIFVLIIEVLQMITKRGIFDINDVYLNIIGGLIGVIIVSRGDKSE